MKILEEAEKLINSPLAKRLLGVNEQASAIPPAPAVVGVVNPVQPPKDYKPLIYGGVALIVLVLGMAFALRKG
jgi:hypothetical protein